VAPKAPAASTFTLTVTADREGWVYGRTQDPTNCTMKLVKAIRQSDGTDVTANLWQTERTVQPDFTTIIDNRLHLADSIIALDGSAVETYTLYYEPKPAAAPIVERIDLLPADGDEPLKAMKARIVFAQPVKAESVDAADVVMTVGSLDYNVNVTAESDTTFIVDWAGQPRLYEGMATLTVFTSGIENMEGTAGSMNKSVSWQAAIHWPAADVNHDYAIDLRDLRLVINAIAKGTTTGDGLLSPPDVNGDSHTDIGDVLTIIRAIDKKSKKF
jgi:hypothetical protein